MAPSPKWRGCGQSLFGAGRVKAPSRFRRLTPSVYWAVFGYTDDVLLSALVLNYRSARATVACVRALLQQTTAADMEIVVIDNHSEDESVQWIRNTVRGLPRVHVVETASNLGFGQGYGAGAAHARGDYLLVCNPDKLLPPDGAERLLAVLRGDPGIGIAAPRLVHRDGTVRSSARAFPRPLDVVAKRTLLQHVLPGHVRRYLQTQAPADAQRDTDWVVGGCFMIPRALFLELGGFDERFFLFFEDIDLCRRVWQAGKRVTFVPSVTAVDRKRRLSEGGLLELMTSRIGRIHIMSALRYFHKWQGKPLLGAKTS